MSFRPYSLLAATLIVMAVAIPFISQAQQQGDYPKIFMPKPGPALKGKAKLFFGFDTRRSFINNADVKISGIKVGLDFSRTLKFGIGLHWLNTPIYRTFQVTDSLGMPHNVVSQLNFAYVSLNSEYVFYRSKRWEFSTSTYIGTGGMHFTNLPETQQRFGLVEPDINGQFKFFPWLGIGAGTGYRFMIMRDDRVRSSLNNPIYKIGIRLFIGELYKSIFRPRDVKW